MKWEMMMFFYLGGVVRLVANRVFHAPDFVIASLENGG